MFPTGEEEDRYLYVLEIEANVMYVVKTKELNND